jgi:hypothetical protein
MSFMGKKPAGVSGGLGGLGGHCFQPEAHGGFQVIFGIGWPLAFGADAE